MRWLQINVSLLSSIIHVIQLSSLLHHVSLHIPANNVKIWVEFNISDTAVLFSASEQRIYNDSIKVYLCVCIGPIYIYRCVCVLGRTRLFSLIIVWHSLWQQGPMSELGWWQSITYARWSGECSPTHRSLDHTNRCPLHVCPKRQESDNKPAAKGNCFHWRTDVHLRWPRYDRMSVGYCFSPQLGFGVLYWIWLQLSHTYNDK